MHQTPGQMKHDLHQDFVGFGADSVDRTEARREALQAKESICKVGEEADRMTELE